MSAIVDYSYYEYTYKGTEADGASFPALNAHAARIIGSMTRWEVDETNIGELPSFIQTLYKLAICAQIDFLAINGIESITSGNGEGFTVGKVRVDGKGSSKGGAMSASISPSAVAYLEQTGLLYRGVGVAQC